MTSGYNYKFINFNCCKRLIDFVKEDVGDRFNDIKNQQKIVHSLPNSLLDELNSDLSSMGFPPMLYIQSYLRDPNSTQLIHIDGYGDIIHAAINLPVTGTVGSKHRYYSGNYSIKQVIIKDLQFYNLTWNDEPVLEEEFELTAPCLLRVDVPHQAVANGKEIRWITTLRFSGNPTYNDLLEKYENYIKSITD